MLKFFPLGTTIPASSITEIASTLSYKFINISDFDIKKLQEYNQGFLETIIPANTYKNQVKTLEQLDTFTMLFVDVMKRRRTLFYF